MPPPCFPSCHDPIVNFQTPSISVIHTERWAYSDVKGTDDAAQRTYNSEACRAQHNIMLSSSLSSRRYPRLQYMHPTVLHYLNSDHSTLCITLLVKLRVNVPRCVLSLPRSRGPTTITVALAQFWHFSWTPATCVYLNGHPFSSPHHRPEHSRWHARHPVLCSSPTDGCCPSWPAHNNDEFDAPSASLRHVMLYDCIVDMGPLASC